MPDDRALDHQRDGMVAKPAELVNRAPVDRVNVSWGVGCAFPGDLSELASNQIEEVLLKLPVQYQRCQRVAMVVRYLRIAAPPFYRRLVLMQPNPVTQRLV